jgi:hypothetical protein
MDTTSSNPASTTTSTTTIIVDAAITKPEALDAIAAAVGSPVRGAGTAMPHIALPDGGRIVVDIPKFGEAPPLAIDITIPGGALEARLAAQTLLESLASTTGWSVHHLHGKPKLA